MEFKEYGAEHLTLNPFKFFKEDLVLITAGTPEKANTMTAGWGGLGVFCQKNVATVYIRPQRYTKEFVDTNECFSVTAFPTGNRDQLNYLGRVSGRDEDKIASVRYHLAFSGGTPYISEGNLVLICKKMLHLDIAQANFDDPRYASLFPKQDYHTIYIAEIEKILVKE